jgi:hypothetical protein
LKVRKAFALVVSDKLPPPENERLPVPPLASPKVMTTDPPLRLV